jgi:hypothetical protein
MNRIVEPVIADAGTDKTKVVLECPRCHWVFEAQRPDGAHPASSFEKPTEQSVEGNIMQNQHICRNPRCKKAFAVYWFEPIDFFNRI